MHGPAAAGSIAVTIAARGKRRLMVCSKGPRWNMGGIRSWSWSWSVSKTVGLLQGEITAEWGELPNTP
ncbi:uncharacterized protein LAJ45_08174 [Morchella importuna]|uniref:uncharacterized protein n=1 Tax=Morchella importuna TaxID=1174673 RepID=UPI001E8D9E5D|nr:uncharacterized protein LAJ45_08174 [Morchella importuna]KAH8147709.1 hypothetical protein LAJ45_08174 [Morchella importuna]